MTVLIDPACSFLVANLNALGRRNDDLRARISSLPSTANIVFDETRDGVVAGSHHGRLLCSRVEPLAEAVRLADTVDQVEHAAVVVLGFGMGWHVRRLAEGSRKSTLIVVYEPDTALLREVFERVDHSGWMRDALILFITDEEDRGNLAGKLAGAEAILGQGVHILEHPPSRARLGDGAARFVKHFREHVEAAKTTLATTLMRSVDTTRNLLQNLDNYVAGCGIAELANVAAGFPAVLVSAGPSLHRNMRLLGENGVRDRCVIIAVQTALRPLLDAGIRPHFVTALDYHEISRRFYEDLDPEALRDVTLVADPKVHPVVLDVYPGPIRCCASGLLDKVLGDLARPMGDLPAGATVAHLAMYLARHLGCDPVAMIGQDLGFTDGLYYGPGAAIHDTWAPELNLFNTIAMMEWQRIARHRTHLRRTQDVHHRGMYTDAQMLAYLQQFERDCAMDAARGRTTIDATEGGSFKQHTIPMPLREFLRTHAVTSLPPLPLPLRHTSPGDAGRLVAVASRLARMATEMARLGDLSRDTCRILERMLSDQRDAARMANHFDRIDANRREVESRMDAFELLNHMDQMGVFRRMKADRRLHMSDGLDAFAIQRGQLERDLENVRWLADSADEMQAMLRSAAQLVEGNGSKACTHHRDTVRAPAGVMPRIAALIPLNPRSSGLGINRPLDARFGDQSVLQATLERLGQSATLHSIVLIAPRGFDVEPLIDHRRIGLSVEVERCDGDSPFGPEHDAIAVARLFADTCWRGGVAGMSAYDEVLCPAVMSEVMSRRGLSAALLCGPDWPLVNVTGEAGCDSVVRRHLEQPTRHGVVFTQAPPGLCGCLISASLMRELAQRSRLSTVGGLLVYQPHAPQHDPIARDACVQTPREVRAAMTRMVFDSKRWRGLMAQGAETIADDAAYASVPQHVVLECTTRRTSRGIFARSIGSPVQARRELDEALLTSLLREIAAADIDDLVLSLHGAGDPLLHPWFDRVIREAKAGGVRAVHVRTELMCDQGTIDRLLESGVDIVSVDLNADRAVTYQAMMGVDAFRETLQNMEYLVEHRRRLTPQTGSSAIALPWVVPHLQRRAETYEDIDTFFDRWQHMLGTAIIDDPPEADSRPIGLTPAMTPPRVVRRDAMRRMTIRCDGSVPLRDLDLSGTDVVGNVCECPLPKIWQELRAARQAQWSREHP